MSNDNILNEKKINKPESADVANRNYVGTKETVAYILDDISQSFNIEKHMEIYQVDVLKIGLNFLAVYEFVKSVWDAVNDIFVASIIDKTRTRWGKFKPWLLVYAFPGVALSVLFWFMPLFFKNSGLYDVSKLATFMILQLLMELANTVISVARTGMTATITPNVIERTKLITQAQFFSGLIEKAPEIIFGFIMQLIDDKIIKLPLSTLFVSAGTVTTVFAGAMALFYACVAKERIMQTTEKPKILDGFKTIIYNKPLLLLTLSEFLGAFSTSGKISLYYRNVLGLDIMSTIVGIPGAVVSPLSYSYVSWARKKFSTRALWVSGSHIDNLLLCGVFAVGSINKNYKKLGAMIPAFMIRETIWNFFFGIRKVIPEELRNEAIDYGEWKNGYRSEGMTGVAKSLVSKLVRSFSGSLSNFILSRVGYVQGAAIGKQSDRTEFALFAMCTILPSVTGLLSIIPKFFYDLNGEKRDRMYAELAERRKNTAARLAKINK